MTHEPRTHHDYSERQVEAARRVLIDLGQVLASFTDAIVVVGGWVPDLLIPDAEQRHVGSIDVDLALDPDKLRRGRYAEMVKALLETRRYQQTDQWFKLRADVDLHDGGVSIAVDVDFMKPHERRRGKPAKLLAGFRPFDADGCAVAFNSPEEMTLEGHMITGAENCVQIRVASVADFLVMKAFALAGRDKPKDAYDICYCLEYAAGGIEALASAWRARRQDPLFVAAMDHLRTRFATVRSYGCAQVAIFHDAATPDESAMHARRAHELVHRFLAAIEA